MPNSGTPSTAYLVGAEADGLVLSNSPVGGGTFKMPFANIYEISPDEPKGWGTAINQLENGNYAEAEQAFAELAETYAAFVPWKDGFGSVARLNQFRALKGQAKFPELATAMDRQLAKPLVLGESNTLEFNELRGWALIGKADILALQTYLSEFQEPSAGKLSLQPPFKRNVPARVIAALSFMRGHLNEKQQRPDLALVDYHTALTYNLGSEKLLFNLATTSALKLVAAKLTSKPDDVGLKRMAHSLAMIYRDIVGKGKVPQEFTPFLEPLEEESAPEPPAEKAGPTDTKEEPKPEASAPAAKGGAPAKAKAK